VLIRLDVSRHCIETAIRKRYNRLVGEALKTDPWEEQMEAELELLKAALEKFDFGRLRSVYPALAGHGTDIVELEASPKGKLGIRINGKPVESS